MPTSVLEHGTVRCYAYGRTSIFADKLRLLYTFLMGINIWPLDLVLVVLLLPCILREELENPGFSDSLSF